MGRDWIEGSLFVGSYLAQAALSLGALALLTQTYRPSEQLKVQAINEFIIFWLAALSTLSAGWLYERFGWITLNLTVLPLLAVALLSTVSIKRRRRLSEQAA